MGRGADPAWGLVAAMLVLVGPRGCLKAKAKGQGQGQGWQCVSHRMVEHLGVCLRPRLSTNTSCWQLEMVRVSSGCT